MDQETQNISTNDKLEQALLLAALKLFVAKGYFNTSLTDIKLAAKLNSLADIYNHYGSKQELACALYGHIIDSLNISVDDIRRRNKKASEQLRGIVDLLFRLAEEAPDVMRFLLQVKIDEFLPEQKRLIDSAPFTKIIKIIQNGIKEGEIRSIDPLLAYGHFFGIVNGTLQFLLTGALEKKADVYQSQTWLSAWNSIATNKRS